MTQSRGFTLVEVVVVVVVASILAVGGYMFYRSQHPSDSTVQTTDTTPSNYKSTADLDNGQQSIDQTDVDTSLDASLKELDSEAAQF